MNMSRMTPPCVGIFTGRVLRDVHGRKTLLTCGVLAGGWPSAVRLRPQERFSTRTMSKL